MSPNNEKTPPAGRIEWLDGARGAAVLLMLGWHFLWDMTAFGFLPSEVMRSVPATLLRYLGGCAFVWIAGVSCRLTRSNLRRGVVTLLCAAVVTLVTAAAKTPVWFGVLHLLGLSMLLYAAVGKSSKLSRKHRIWEPVSCCSPRFSS